MLSQSEEKYLKAIYNVTPAIKGRAGTTSIAEKLKTKASSVTDMVKKLADKNLVNYTKYKGVSLTSSGKKIAIRIVRKHRLWEVFLVDKLKFSWNEVHDLAEQLEHVKSDSLVDRMDDFLGFPSYDPHGDPIPDKEGNIQHHKELMLSSVALNQHCLVIGVKDSSSDFLSYLDHLNIHLGSRIKVLSKEKFDNSMLIENNLKSISISHQISKNLFVKNL